MQITVDQDEIVEAIKDFIGKQGIAIKNKTLEVSLTAGRSPVGHSASVDIKDAPDAPTGNTHMENFRLPSTTDKDVEKDVAEVEKILNEELTKGTGKKEAPEKTPLPEEEPEPAEEDTPFGEEATDDHPPAWEKEEVPVTEEEDDDVDSLFGS